MELHHTAQRSCKLLSILRTELQLSSTRVKRLKAADGFRVNGQSVHTDHPIRSGDRICVRLAEAPPAFPPEDGPLEILYEDEALLALDKPAGLWIHPTAGRNSGTLANRVAGYYQKTGQACGIHPVTRLDRDTFGVCLLAKNAHVHALLSHALQQGSLHKTYLATVVGTPAQTADVITLPIARRDGGSLLREVRPDGQAARTGYRVTATSGELSLLELQPQTGRTHQLRVHCAAIGCPILGDRQYGTPAAITAAERCGVGVQQLCAAALSLAHPLTGAPLAIISRQKPFWPEVFSI